MYIRIELGGAQTGKREMLELKRGRKAAGNGSGEQWRRRERGSMALRESALPCTVLNSMQVNH